MMTLRSKCAKQINSHRRHRSRISKITIIDRPPPSYNAALEKCSLRQRWPRLDEQFERSDVMKKDIIIGGTMLALTVAVAGCSKHTASATSTTAKEKPAATTAMREKSSPAQQKTMKPITPVNGTTNRPAAQRKEPRHQKRRKPLSEFCRKNGRMKLTIGVRMQEVYFKGENDES